MPKNKSSDPESPELLAESSGLGAARAPARLKALGSALLPRSLLPVQSWGVTLTAVCIWFCPRHAHHLSSSPAWGTWPLLRSRPPAWLLRFSPSLVPLGLCTPPVSRDEALSPGWDIWDPTMPGTPASHAPGPKWTLQLWALRWTQPCRTPILMLLRSREMEN